MKRTIALLTLTISLSTLTVWSQPGLGGRGDNASGDSDSPPEVRRVPSDQRQPDPQRLRTQRQKQRRQREFVPGPRGLGRRSDRQFGRNSRSMTRPDVAPQRGARRGFAPGNKPRDFGAPPVMDQGRPRMAGPGRGQFLPPMGRGQFRPGMGPGVGPRRPGFSGPPMMDQRPWGGRGQFQPPSGTRPGRPDMDRGMGPMRRGFGGPPMLNQRGPIPRRDFDPAAREPGVGGPNNVRRGQERSDGKDNRKGPPRGREENLGNSPKAPPDRDQN